MGSCWGQGGISNAVIELLLTLLVSTVLPRHGANGQTLPGALGVTQSW